MDIISKKKKMNESPQLGIEAIHNIIFQKDRLPLNRIHQYASIFHKASYF